MRGLLHSRDAAVICCRGNHDFTDLAPMFGDGEVFEISEDPTRVFARDFGAGTLKFGGLRGVRAHRRRWSDELRHEEFADRVRRLPIDLDVLVTHAPPKGVLDKIPGQAVGSFALRSYVSRHDPSLPPLLAHLFGHIHEAQGVRTLGSTIFSNASGGWNVIDL
jgi:Icc-related predicted phosphoesterase